MRGHVARKGAKYYCVVEMGKQPAQRCGACGRRHWVDGDRLGSCPRCRGELLDTTERRQSWRGAWTSRKEADRELTALLGQRDAGTLTAPSRATLESFVTSEWLPEAATRLRPTTVAGYEWVLNRLALPRIGHLRLTEITPRHIADLYQTLLASGGRDGGELSNRSVELTARVLHRVLADAAARGYVARSPADRVQAPKAQRRQMRAWNESDARAFLAFVATHRLRALWVLLLSTGCRRGEALGLPWSHVDLDARRISIERTLVSVGYRLEWSQPKTAAGRRTVSLDPATVAELRAHRARQLEERLAAGDAWQRADDLVFCREDGTPLQPQAVSKMFERLVRDAGLPSLSLHGLRHTAATAGLRAGIPTKLMSVRLGHSNTSITEMLYQHVTPEMESDTAEKLGAVFLGDMPPRQSP